MDTDYLELVSWAIASLGLLSCWLIAKPSDEDDKAPIFGSFIIIIFLIIPLTFLTLIVNTVCIANGLCISKGDGNIGYLFYPFYMSPLYFIVLLIRSSSKKNKNT